MGWVDHRGAEAPTMKMETLGPRHMRNDEKRGAPAQRAPSLRRFGILGYSVVTVLLFLF
jgi:hypothetical protein